MNDMIMQTVLWLTAGGLLVMLMMRRRKRKHSGRCVSMRGNDPVSEAGRPLPSRRDGTGLQR